MARFIQYIKDTRREMAHVSWPTRIQTIAFTILVVLVSILIALYLGALDFVLTQGLEFTLEHGSRFPQGTDVNPVLDVDVAPASTGASDSTVTPIEE